MTSTLKITVVTPCFNMERYVGRTIESTLASLRPGDEYFIIDGGSTDGSVDIIKSYQARLSGWLSEPDEGYADALSKGFALASGDILCWINASDLLLAGSLDAVRQQMALTRSDFIFGDDFYIDDADRVLSYSRGYVRDLRAAMLYGGWTPLQDACFWRRELYQAAGGIDARVGLAADYDLFLRMSALGRVTYVPAAFSAFRRHSGQKSIAGSKEYRRERHAARERALRNTKTAAWRKGIAVAWHSAAVRWRLHVQQRSWQRPDLHGRHVSALAAGPYWPVADGSGR